MPNARARVGDVVPWADAHGDLLPPHQRLRVVLEWAVAMEYRIDNPSDRIGPVLGPQHDVTEHMRALPHGEVAEAIRTVQAATALPAAKLAFEYLVLTAARWSEVRWAEWAEIDRDAGVWTVPARRMKANRRHRVPLCSRALEILEEAQALGEGAGSLVFTRGQGKPLTDKELRWLVREQGIAAVPHGFRSSFRDWAAEETDHPRDVIEAAPCSRRIRRTASSSTEAMVRQDVPWSRLCR